MIPALLMACLVPLLPGEVPPGLARAEQSLRDALREAYLGQGGAGGVHERLVQAAEGAGPGATERDLARALHWAAALAAAAPESPRIPADPGLLFVLARDVPLPTPASWVPTLGEELGRSTRRDLALLELLAKAPSAACRPLLREVSREPGRDALLQAAAADLLAGHEDVADLSVLGPLSRRASPEIRFYARQSLTRVLGRARQQRRDGEAARWRAAESLRVWPSEESALAAAEAELRTLGDAYRAAVRLDGLIAATEGARDTARLAVRGQALLGRAWASWLIGPTEEARQWLARVDDLGRDFLRQENTLEAVRLRVRLVDGLLRGLAGEEVSFTAALEEAPRDADRNLLDQAFFGRFGPQFGLPLLRRSGRAGDYLVLLEGLLADVEATSSTTDYGLLDRQPDREEWGASWVAHTVAQLILEDAGDPARCRAALAPRLEVLEGLSHPANLQLLGWCRLLDARAALYEGDAAAALQSLDAAHRVVTALRRSHHDYYLRELDRGEVPATAPERTLWRNRGPHSDLLGQILLARSNLHATLEADAAAAARDLWEAGRRPALDRRPLAPRGPRPGAARPGGLRAARLCSR